jgi:titin
LDWTGSPNAAGYRIEGSTDGGTNWNNPTLTPVGKDTTTYMTGLTCAIPYQYRVRAYNSQGNWGSSVASVRTDGCNTPAISVLAESQKRIHLSWVNTLVTASGFKVQRSSNGSSDWQDIGTAPGDASEYSDYSDIPIESLVCGTPYYYRIQAFNNNDGIIDIWSWSNTANTSTKPCGSPPTPIGLAAKPHTSHSNVITWILDDADTYQVERSLIGSTGWISLGSPLSQDTTRILDNQVEPGITYYYHIRATNNLYGDSLFSAAVPVQTYLSDFFTPLVLR